MFLGDRCYIVRFSVVHCCSHELHIIKGTNMCGLFCRANIALEKARQVTRGEDEKVSLYLIHVQGMHYECIEHVCIHIMLSNFFNNTCLPKRGDSIPYYLFCLRGETVSHTICSA